MSEPKKAILVTGATGNQGGHTIEQLLEAGALSTHDILAVTRNAQSDPAKKLASKGVKIVSGDLDNVEPIFTSAEKLLGSSRKVWGVYSVQAFIGKGASVESEERQGKALVDASIAHGVKHFVYGSIDRGGDQSFDNETDVPHFASKHRVEHHLVAQAEGKMDWTILRPAFFMENMAPAGLVTKLTAAMWKTGVAKNKPLQAVSARDIGYYAAQSFLHPAAYARKSISLAGDALTYEQFAALFQSKIGRPLATSPSFLAWTALKLSGEMGSMFRFFDKQGYGADIPALKKSHPTLWTWADWFDNEGKKQWAAQ